MTVVPGTQTMTATEFLELPRDRGGFSSWLVEGEVVVNEPKAPHQRVVVTLIQALANWRDGGAGRGHVYSPLDTLIDDCNVYAPDVCWFREKRDPAAAGAIDYAMPDLAIEVRSPSTWRYDIGSKKSGYERTGLPELWLVDTAASEVLVFRRSQPSAGTFDVSLEFAPGDVLESPQLPGFALPPERLFG
jgi:Uma2 family endonuclease